MITIIVTVLLLVYKSFCNTVCIYGHANKTSCCCYTYALHLHLHSIQVKLALLFITQEKALL